MFKLKLFILTSLFFCFQAASQKLLVATDLWCPYICEQPSAPGVLTEVINEIASHNEWQIDLQIVPLSRALVMAENAEVDMVLAVTQEHIDNYHLQTSHQFFGGWYNDFYALTLPDFDLSTRQGLVSFIKSKNNLGVIKGYDYGSVLTNVIKLYPNDIHYSTGDSPLISNLKMLQKGRLDVILDSRFNIEYELRRLKITNAIRVATEGGFTPLFLGFRANLDKEIIKTFDSGLKQLRTTGRLNEILEKYGIEDWLNEGSKNHLQ